MSVGNIIKKRCEECDLLFDIQIIHRDTIARKKMLTYTPCSHCGHIPFADEKIRTSKRCADCSIPFAVIDYYAKGRCKRCMARYYRGNTTKT